MSISFCNCLHIEAILSANGSLKKKKKGGGGKGKLYTEMARKTEKMDHATGLPLTASTGTTNKSFGQALSN